MIVGWRVFYCCLILCFTLFSFSWICRSKGDHVGIVNFNWEACTLASLWGIFMINCWPRGLSPSLRDAIFGQVVLSCRKEKMEHTRESKKASNILSWSLMCWFAASHFPPEFTHWLPSTRSCVVEVKINKPLPLQVDYDLYHIKGNLTRTVLCSRKGRSLTDMTMLTFF